MRRGQTPSQTVGPFFAYAMTPEQYGYGYPGIAGPVLVDADTEGERIALVGQVFDGDGAAIEDAVIEGKAKVHHAAYGDPVANDNRSPDYRLSGEDRGLWVVDYGLGYDRPQCARVVDGECSTADLSQSQLAPVGLSAQVVDGPG